MGGFDLKAGVIFGGPIRTKTASAANQWCGRTALNSGSTTVTVSTNIVNSNSVISGLMESTTDQTSGSITRGLEVRTISPGNFFTMGFADGVVSPRNVTIHWFLILAD